MEISFWGTRGSIPTINSNTQKYGGNTPCVALSSGDTLLILDAGSGIRVLGENFPLEPYSSIHLLLTHFHMDHIQGLGFFGPFFNKKREFHIWGPGNSDFSLHDRLSRYLSPPLFPVRLKEFPATLHLHEVPLEPFRMDGFDALATYVCHPGPTVGYRLENGGKTFVFIPDHEPALGTRPFPWAKDWISGIDLAKNADLLIHDGQYTKEEYLVRMGWGHSSVDHAMAFARLSEVKNLVLFHHDPSHTDEVLDRLSVYCTKNKGSLEEVQLAREGMTISL